MYGNFALDGLDPMQMLKFQVIFFKPRQCHIFQYKVVKFSVYTNFDLLFLFLKFTVPTSGFQFTQKQERKSQYTIWRNVDTSLGCRDLKVACV